METTLKTKTDLGCAKRFPQKLAPCERDTIREMTRIALLTQDQRTDGVPPAYRNGVILGMRDAFTEAIPMAEEMGKPELAAGIRSVLQLIGLAEVEE